MATATTLTVVESDAAEAVWFLGTLALILGSTDTTAGVSDQTEFLHPPRFATPLHVHHHSDEVFYVLEGTMHGVFDQEEWFAYPGSYVWLPKGIPHGYAACGDQPLRSIAMTMPGSLSDFVRDAGTPALSRTLPPADLAIDIALVDAAATRYGVTHLGPPLTDLC